ncbi:MAG: hypothetical protein FD123_1 [Bacteroidetes bacterium]|nr:MAG: hypothetical protein FD123_1 [Bacteroidota bacterium]
MSKTTIKVYIPYSIGDLAHLLGRPGSPVKALKALENNMPNVLTVAFVNAKEQIAFAKANLELRLLRFWHIDSAHISHIVVYFTANLTGTEEELAKVVGKERPFLPFEE